MNLGGGLRLMVYVQRNNNSLEPDAFIKYEVLLYAAVFFNILITIMNTSMFNVAIPTITEFFKVDAQSASIIVSSYSIVFALSAILYSKLSASVPIKWLLLIGISLLGVGSLIGIITSSYFGLIVARTIQALGASSISALSIILTTRYVPFNRRGIRLGLVGAAVTLGLGIGPLLGGLLTEFLGWRYLFGVSLLSLIGIPFYFLLLPLEKKTKAVFDYMGMFIFLVAMITFLSAISYSWLVSPFVIAFLVIFLWHIKRHKAPFLQPELLTKTFLSITGIGFIIFFCNFSFMFLLPLRLARSFGMESSAMIGLTLFPGALTAVVISLLAGRTVDRIGAKRVAFVGIILMATAALTASLFGNTSIILLIIIFSVSSCGFVCITTSLPNMLTKLLPKEQLATGIGTLQLFQFMGGGVGVTVSGKLLTQFEDMTLVVFGVLFIFAITALALYFYSSRKSLY